MAELYQQEKLQPSLLDRLTDDAKVAVVAVAGSNSSADMAATDQPSDDGYLDAPAVTVDRFSISSRRLKEYVARDLASLLNTHSLDAVSDIADYPLASRSVLNYGVPPLTGVSYSNIEVHELERCIRNAIIYFEPRILKETLTVKVRKSDNMSIQSISLEIECDVWGQPSPEHLVVVSQLDLERGLFELSGK